MEEAIPTPSLVVLVGAPASGKSTWAAEHFRPEQIVCADTLRGIVGEHELDLSATDDAFDLLDRIVGLRLGRGLTTVVDTTGLEPKRRASYLAAARAAGAMAIAVRFGTTAAECKRRNRERAHPVPAKALDQMIKKARSVDLDAEGWDRVIEPTPVRTVTERLTDAVVAADSRHAGEPSEPSAPTSRLRFGLLVSDYSWADEPSELAAGLTRIAHEAERVGFDTFWVMDHLVQIPQVGRAWDPMLDAWSVLAHVAAGTHRIRLGALVSPITFRHPVLLAKSIATLDVLSGGRAIAGIGAGSSPREHEQLGLPFGSPAERLARLRDTTRALPILLGPGGKPFEGETLTIPDTSLYPRPIQERVPIVVGGSGERVTLRIAAEFADGCNLFGAPAAVERLVARLHQHCADVGRDPRDVEVGHLGSILLGADAPDVRARIEALRPADVGPDRFAERANAGTVDDHTAGFERLVDTGVQHAVIDVAGIGSPDALAPFGALIGRFR